MNITPELVFAVIGAWCTLAFLLCAAWIAACTAIRRRRP